MHGVIRSYGDKAIAIESSTKQQYYAPFENVDKNVKDLLTRPLRQGIVVDFKVDKTNITGIRFYATNVTIYQITI